MENLNYEDDVRIDSDALDVEWLKQADLMRKYAKHAADTKKEMDESKERLETGKAKIEMGIRQDPKAYGLEKVTEGAIQSTIQLQQEYQKLNQDYINAKYENDVAVAVVRAIDQKKTALENLVKLLGVSYFAGPQAPRDLTQEKLNEQGQKQKNKNVKVSRRNKEK